MNALSVPEAPSRKLQASLAPFDLPSAWAELEGWERKLLPPEKLFGPKLGFCRSLTGGYVATRWSPMYHDILWTCEGPDPRAVMKAFRAHLRGLA